MSSFPAITINNFIGLNKSRDDFSLLPGQLSKNNNYRYMVNGGLQERGGGAELTVAPSSGNPIYGFANYFNDEGNNFLLCAQGTDIYYYNTGTSAWVALSLTLTNNAVTRFEQAGFSTNRNIYAVNGNDSIIKITTTTAVPAGSLISGGSIPTDGTSIKLHKNRMFVGVDDTLYFTDALAFDWTGSPSNINIAPGIDGKIKALEVWGDSLFIFKEFGVYVLPNADDPSPNTSWVVLRTDAKMGTLSPDTVKRTKIGIMYLSTDNFIRLLSPNITFSSGEFTLGGSGSPIVSETIQDDLNELLDNTNKSNASAVVKDDEYIVSFQSINNSGSYNDLTYFADTSKVLKLPNIFTPQPMWGEYTGFNYNFYALQEDSGKELLYGAKGATGAVQETLNDGIHNDDGAAIESHAVLGWYPIQSEAIYKNIKQIYFMGQTESWNLDLVFNVYKQNELLPAEGTGLEKEFSLFDNSSLATVGSALVGTALVSESGIQSKKYRLGLKGYYFRAEFKNLNANEFTRVYKLILYFRAKRQR